MRAVLASASLASPAPQIIGVESHAKQVGGDESELFGTHADDANEHAVGRGDDPALPKLLADQDRRQHSQCAGYVVKPEHLFLASVKSRSSQLRVYVYIALI
jgi:hypothetical protein